MEAASILAGRPAAVASDASAAAVAARDAKLDPKLVAAAHSFEASLMQELLKPLNGGGVFGGDGDDDDGKIGGGGLDGLASSADGSGGALASFGSEALATALSQKGGLGIARRILDHFESANTTGVDAAKASRTGVNETGGSGNRRAQISRRN